MKKTLTLLLSAALLAGQAIAQNTAIVENAQKSQYEGSSYLVVGSLTLKPGFNFNSAQQGTFFARAYDNEPSTAPTEDRNFIRSEAVFSEGITTDGQVIALGTGDKLSSFSYSDGAGRGIQSIQARASPTLKDIVRPSYFDGKNRPSRSYLPYTSTGSDGGFRPGALTEQASFYNNPPPGVTGDSRAYSTTVFEDSPLERVLSTTHVGNDFQNTTAKGRFTVNTANTIRKWEIVGGLPRSTTTYPAGSLSVGESTDEAGAVSRTYTDFAGRTVLTQVRATSSTWLDTYYVYNDYNELLFTIPPESASTFTPSKDHANLWHFQYRYDELGRQTESRVPGAGWVYTVYDRWDRAVLTQDSVQRIKTIPEWSFVKYDIHNRPVVAGIIATTDTRALLTTSVANASIRNEIRNLSAVGYTLNRTYPTTATDSNLISITYYDDYGFRTNAGWSNDNGLYAFAAEPLYTGQELAPGIKGIATGSKSRTQGTNTQWINSVTYYDKHYRAIQSISNHQMGGTVKTSTQYAFSGEVQKSLNTYTHTGGTTSVEGRYTYDHAGRPLKVYHKVNSNPEVMLSHFRYNEMGEATDILHHSRDDGNTWLYKTQSRSTIQGWLDEVQYLYANNDLVFKQKLDYNKASGTSNDPRLDGHITSNQWKHYGTEPERAYNYDYDIPKRLTMAGYLEKRGASWTLDHFYSENIIYGANGNITALARNRENSGVMAQIDKLTYTYSGNQLTGVSDIAPAAYKAEGFRDGNTSGADYTYNGNGYLKEDKNKGITSIAYNLLDLPTQVNFDSNSINYTYSAGGGLMTVAYQGNGGFPNKTVQYVGELVFEGSSLMEIRHGSGRVLADADYRYQYYLTDHLGSTRVVLQEDPANFTVMATFEQAAIEEESMQFMDYENSVKIASELFDHTGTEKTGQALRLIGGETGPARSVSVLPGDTVKMEVYAKYLNLSQTKTNPALMAVAASLAGGSPAVMGVEGGLSAPAATSASGSNGLAALLTGKQQNDGAPPAYLNYLFFDQEMNYKYGGFVQMSEAAQEDGTGRQHERLYQEAVAEEPGYFYIYLSNESTEGGEAFFDDFGITTLESYIVQQTDYYAYGLTARNYVRAGEKETLDLFQGKTYEELTGWYDFHARQYDAALGRWFGVDHKAAMMPGMSPYSGMGNNPVMMVDPDGKMPVLALMALGAVINTTIQGMSGNINSLGDFALSMGIGALSGAAGFGAGQLVSGALGASTTLGGSILNGALTGAAGGFSGGFVGGAGNAWAGGAGFNSGVGAGLRTGGFGAITGGVIGGVSGGIQYGKQIAVFRKGNSELGIHSSDAVSATDDFLNQAQKTWYPDAPMGHVGKFTVENVPASHQAVLDKAGAAARTVPLSQGGVYTGNSNVYFNKNLAFTSAKRLFFTMGHEFVHVSQFASLAGQSSSLTDLLSFRDLLEYHAYSYEYNVLGSSNYGGFTPDAVRKLMTQHPDYFQSLSYTNYPWTRTAKFIYPFR